jgi:segregation and condensation protein B
VAPPLVDVTPVRYKRDHARNFVSRMRQKRKARARAEADIVALGEAAEDALGREAGALDDLEAGGDDAPEDAGDEGGEGEGGEAEGGEAEASAGDTLRAADLDPPRFKALIEALIFASDKPVTLQRLRQLTRVKDAARIQGAIDELLADYEGRGIALQGVSGGYMFRTQSGFSTWVQQLIAGRPVRLSRAQLETLAIIAYRQPITRPEIDDIRGVDSAGTLHVLLDRHLIRILGKKEEPGRPLIYGTTREFLDFFSLGDLRDLPTLREYSELTEESRRVVDGLGGAPAAEPAEPEAAAEPGEPEVAAEPEMAAEPEAAADDDRPASDAESAA